MDYHQHQLPDGWKRLEDDTGSTFYLTRHPEVKISKRCQLESYQKKGRYLEMNLGDLDFGTKRRSRKYSAVQVIRFVKGFLIKVTLDQLTREIVML